MASTKETAACHGTVNHTEMEVNGNHNTTPHVHSTCGGGNSGKDINDNNPTTMMSNGTTGGTTSTNDPWLSKPRIEPSLYCANSNCDQCRGDMKSYCKCTYNHDSTLKLETLKLALSYLGFEPRQKQWSTMCSVLQATEQDHVKFGDFVAAAKQVLATEFEQTGVKSDEIYGVASGLRGQSCENRNNSVLLSVLTDRIIQLREETKTHKNELGDLKHSLEEVTNTKAELQYEMNLLRKELKEAHKVNHILKHRMSSQTQPRATPHKQTKKVAAETGTQTASSVTEAEKRLSMVTKRHHRAEFNYHLHKIATDKLLKFTRVVHDKLIEYYNAKPVACVDELMSTLPKKPTKVNRASSMQVINDSSRYLSNKNGTNIKVTRVTSMCDKHTKSDPEPLVHMKLVDCKHRELLLLRIAQKAKELVDGISEILEDCEVPQNIVHFRMNNKITTNKGKENVNTAKKIENTAATSITVPVKDEKVDKAVVWV